MQHKVRVAQQEDAARQLDTEMQEEVKRTKTNGTVIQIVMDWKMKWEQRGKNETAQEHCGKRGMSWHGACGFHCRWADEHVEKVALKLDQIMDGDSEQSREAALSMTEAAVCASEVEVPFITEAVICSDNAGCHHKKEFALGVVAINLMTGHTIVIKSLVHSETQNGKGLVDADLDWAPAK